MTHVEPDQTPEIQPPDPIQPEIDPGAAPDEMPPLDPAGGDPAIRARTARFRPEVQRK